MRTKYSHQDLAQPKQSLMQRLATNRFVQVSALGGSILAATACSSEQDNRGIGDAVPGAQIKSDVLILANADGFPNTSIQCVEDVVIFSNTRTGGVTEVLPNQPDLCAAVAQTLKNHPSVDGSATQIQHLDCPAEPINPVLAQEVRSLGSFGLCG